MPVEAAFANSHPFRVGAKQLWTRTSIANGPSLRRSLCVRRPRTRWRYSWHASNNPTHHHMTGDVQNASLPDKKALTITTPLFYVNAKPHMGSAYPTMAADVLARFYRLLGANPVFVTGCDEHGEKVAQAAAAASVRAESPRNQQQLSLDRLSVENHVIKQFCDQNVHQFQQLWKALDISYDRFIRTTSSKHADIVRQFMERVWANGDIYKDVYHGMYCTGCEEYKDAKDLVQENLCPTHLKPCQMRNEQNYFFALSKYQQRIHDFHRQNPHFVQPPERRNEVLGWIQDGLRDFSVSRANNPWGIPVPRDPSHTIYVWFDALLGYISALLQDQDPHTLDAAVARGWPAHVHIIGKDILRFHAIYWPAMLMSAGLPLPNQVLGHGFLTKDGLKMGKSLGNTLDPAALVNAYGSDAVRFYFIRGVEFGRDGDFSEQRFIDVVNADLANSLGNLLNRSLNLLLKNCAGILPISADALGNESDHPQISDAQRAAEHDLRLTAVRAKDDARARYLSLDFVGACESVLAIAASANAHIDRVAPWTAFKSNDPVQVQAAQRCIVAMLEVARIVSVGLSPVTPTLSRRIYEALALGEEFDALTWNTAMDWGRLQKGMHLSKPKPVFPRLEVPADRVASELSMSVNN